MYAGSVMIPPQPATASINPPKKTKGQTIANVCQVSSMKSPPRFLQRIMDINDTAWETV